MTADGIHYKILVENASLSEKIRLCPENMQAMLNAACHHYDEKQANTLICACIDIPVAVKDEKSTALILSLIERHCEMEKTDMRDRIMSYIPKIPTNMDENSLRSFLSKNPKTLLTFLKYPNLKHEMESPDEFSSEGIEPEHGLRYYQLAAARNITKHLEHSPHCVMYHAPTGSGKTRTAMSVITRHFRTHGPTAVLWLASSTELVDQAAKAFKTAWTQHGDVNCMLRLWRGNIPHFEPNREPERNILLIAGLQKVALACEKYPDIPEGLQKIVSLIVFDEAHQSVAPTYRRVIGGVMQGGRCRLLGLSATPGRSDMSSTKELAALYQGQKVSIWSPEKINPIEHLVSEGYLARARFHRIDVKGDQPPGNFDNTRDYSLKELRKIGCDLNRNIEIVKIVKGIIDGGHSRILVFSPSVASAQICTTMLKSLHRINKSDMLSATTPKNARAAIISRYSDKDDKEPHVIFNYGILTTGFDAPGTSAAVIARPTTSVSLYSQMVGRAIRGEKSGGNKEADIYTVVDITFPQFGSVAAAFDNWKSQWDGETND